jgi:hypothetical protein
VTCDPTADPDCTTVSSNSSTSGIRATPVMPATTGTLGGMVLLLPGTLLTRMTRRRKRRDRARKAE